VVACETRRGLLTTSPRSLRFSKSRNGSEWWAPASELKLPPTSSEKTLAFFLELSSDNNANESSTRFFFVTGVSTIAKVESAAVGRTARVELGEAGTLPHRGTKPYLAERDPDETKHGHEFLNLILRPLGAETEGKRGSQGSNSKVRPGHRDLQAADRVRPLLSGSASNQGTVSNRNQSRCFRNCKGFVPISFPRGWPRTLQNSNYPSVDRRPRGLTRRVAPSTSSHVLCHPKENTPEGCIMFFLLSLPFRLHGDGKSIYCLGAKPGWFFGSFDWWLGLCREHTSRIPTDFRN